MDNKVNFLRGTATEYEASTKDNDTFYYTADDEKLYLGETEITGGGVTIDDALSDTSKNPVQNKVVKMALDSKANLSDIPTELPANGGNADTVDGFHASSFIQWLGYYSSGSILTIATELNKSGAIYCSKNVTDLPESNKYFFVNILNSDGTIQLTATCFDTGKTYTNRYNTVSKKWYGWANVADGGNADTVDGLGADVIPHGYQTLYTNADLCTKSGYYMLNSTALNIPIAAFGLLVVNNGDYADSAATWAIQTFYPTSNGGAYRRMYVNGSFTTWVNIADGGNASTVNGLTVQTAVPAGAKFTDTTYAAASTSAAGLVSTATQHFGGYKTFPMVGLRTTGTVGTQPSSDINTKIYFTNANVNAPFGEIKNCIRSTAFKNGEVFVSLDSYSNDRTGTCELKVVATNGNSGNYVTITSPTVSSSASCLRKLASGTAEKNTSNCPLGSWYGRHD